MQGAQVRSLVGGANNISHIVQQNQNIEKKKKEIENWDGNIIQLPKWKQTKGLHNRWMDNQNVIFYIQWNTIQPQGKNKAHSDKCYHLDVNWRH